MQNTVSRKTYLYRYFDAAGVLLYVGITRSISKRSARHESISSWFKEHTKMTVEIFPSQYAAAVAEREVIAAEKPKYNVNTGGQLGAPAFDSVVLSVRLTPEDATAFEKAAAQHSMSRTEMLRTMVKNVIKGTK